MAYVLRAQREPSALAEDVRAAVASLDPRLPLYAVHPWDPPTYASAVVLILGGSALACWIPARRAMAVSPMDALRLE